MAKQNGTVPGPLSRRKFLQTTAGVGGGAFLGTQFPWLAGGFGNNGSPKYLTPTEEYTLARPENILYTVCQQCNTQCGIKAKFHNGVLTKVDGNPFSPWNLDPHLPYKTSVFDTATIDGLLCPKGQASIQSAYDPYRVVKVLKRAGPRGSNKWKTIPFSQAVQEIVDGGPLFKDVPGEESRQVTGLKEIWALRDLKIAKDMAADVAVIQGKKTQEEKKKAVDEFKVKYAAHLGTLIDPDHPDLGPKNNQFLFVWGRLKDGRGDFIKRFTGGALGSVNAHGHTTVCQGSLYFAGKAMSEQYQGGKWTGGKKFFWQADQQSAEFMVLVGVNPFEASQGPTLRAPRMTNALVEGRLKYVVVDPRLSRTAAKAWKWLPIQPGTEAAMAMAMARWIIDNKRFDERYLRNANKAAATADKEPTWTNAAWLVAIDKDGTPGKFLRAADIGLTTEDRFVVLSGGEPVAFDANDTATAVEGDLMVDTEIAGIRVKSGLRVLYERAAGRSIEDWATLCGLKADDIVAVAREFTSHGKKAAAEIHRGVSQHTNGLYNCSAWLSLNLLIGSYDWKGGMASASAWDAGGTKTGQPYNVGSLHPDKAAPFGISIIRHDTKYEDSTLFAGYPAKRPWFPLASDIYQELIPSAADAYPYPIKAMIIYMGTPAYSLPAGHTNIAILADPNKIPLVIANDIIIGETSMYADYIFPDAGNLERWEFGGSQPNMIWKVQPIRQPVIPAPNEVATVFGQQMPVTLETMILGLAEKLGLPGFGPDGFGPGQPLTRPEDLYMKMAANVAFGERADGAQAVPDADDREVELFLKARRHLPPTVFDAEKWRQAIKPELWRKTVYVLNRGGRFDDFDKAYSGEQLANKYGAQINLYQEKTATTKDSMTGKPFVGVGHYTPAGVDVLGRPINDQGYDLRLITHREITHTKSRTIANYWLQALLPEGLFTINRRDAQRLGLADGDRVQVISATNPEGVYDLKNGQKKAMVGKLKVIEGIRPGVISYSLGHGHWAYGSADVVVDGQLIKGDERRARGLHANAAMRTDPVLPNTCLQDVLGASAVFYDTNVKLVKVV